MFEHKSIYLDFQINADWLYYWTLQSLSHITGNWKLMWFLTILSTCTNNNFLDTFITYVYKSTLYSAHLESNTIQFTSMNLKINAYFCKLRCIFLPILTLFEALKRNKIHYRVQWSVWEFLPVYQQSTFYVILPFWDLVIQYYGIFIHQVAQIFVPSCR